MNISPIRNLSSHFITPIKANKINNPQKKYNNCDKNLYYHYSVVNVSFQANLSKVPSRLERFEGCLLGGAIGDSLGAPVEFMKLQEIYKKYGPKGITLKSFIDSKTPLEFTDDTQMTFFTADGLLKSSIKNHSKYKINFMDVYESYKDWLRTQMEPFSTFDHGWISKIKNLYQQKSPGVTCINSIMDGEPGTLSYKINNSKGNGGVMRSAPIGLLYYSRPDIAFKTAMACAALTHSNPDAYLSAGAFASIISHIIQGKTLDDAVNRSLVLLKKQENGEDIINKIQQAIELSKSNHPSVSAIETIGRGNIGSEALSLAIYSAIKNKMNFSKSIEMASNINGDSDTVAAITGNIVGAFRGSKGIQKNILSLLSNLKELKILSRDLFMQPKNIVNKDKRYPISEEFSNSYTLDNILEISKKKESNTKKYINFLNKIYKKIENFKIIDYQNFLINKNIPQNILKKIIIPTELIANELKDKTDFHKLLNILLNNYDNLIHKENLRGCFADERCSIEDILWTVYEKALKNGNIDELCKRVSYMVYSREYNIKAIIDSIN